MAIVDRRATDAERDAVSRILTDAALVGMLRQVEWMDRLELLQEAQTREDLKKFYEDLTDEVVPPIGLDWYHSAALAVRDAKISQFLAWATLWAWAAWLLFFGFAVLVNGTGGRTAEGGFVYVFYVYCGLLGLLTLATLVFAQNVGSRIGTMLRRPQ